MNILKLNMLAYGSLSLALSCVHVEVQAQQAEPEPAALVDALNGTFGKHAGKRASHAKGFCTRAEFLPAPGNKLVNVPLFKQKKLDATVRFSIAGGNPNASDKSRSIRGMSARIAGGGETYDLLLISEPAFFAKDPVSFVSFLQARVPDPVTKKPDPAKVAAHNELHPDGKTQPALLAAHAAPFSYATTPYFSTNAFVFASKGKTKQHARIVAEPADGTRYLSDDEEKTLPDLFLEDELKSRLASKPVEFALYAQLPAATDSLTDSTQIWTGKDKVLLGNLRVSGWAEQETCNGIVFMPVTLPKGITPSDDPILKARAPAYSVSFGRRSN